MDPTKSYRDFIQSHIRAAEEVDAAGQPDLSQCLRVNEVAPLSLASAVGIAVGDYLVTVDGKAAASVNPRLYQSSAPSRRYTVYSAELRKSLELETTGIDIGVEVGRTPAALRARRTATPDELLELWKAKEWALLAELSAPMVDAERAHPALAFLGAALWETGRPDDGAALTAEYAEKYAPRWTMCFAAVAHYYDGLAALRRGEQRRGLELLAEAYRNDPFPVIADAIEKHSGLRPPEPKPRWLNRRFPVDYDLTEIGSGRAVGLASTLAQMPAGRVMLVCLLANYRGNGPYNDFMTRYRCFITHFRPFLHGLHVVTMETKRREDRAYFFAAEDEIRAAGLPCAILHDADGAVTEAAAPPGSPRIYAIDCDRRVLHEGDLGSIDIWKLVAGLDAAKAAPAGQGAPLPVPLPPVGQKPLLGDVGQGVPRFPRWMIGLVALPFALGLCSRACRTRRPPTTEEPAILASSVPPGGRQAATEARTAGGAAAPVLRRIQWVHVPIQGQSFASLDEALAKKGYGNVTATDFKPVFVYATKTWQGRTITATVAFSREDLVPSSTTYMSMPVSQFLEALVGDPQTDGLALDLGSPDATGMDKAAAAGLLAELPTRLPPQFKVKRSR